MSDAFKEYIGKEIDVREKPVTYKIGNENYEEVQYSVSENDPILTEIFNKSSKTRVILPDMMVTMDYDTTRLNVHIDKDDKGTWRIADIKLG